MIAFSEEIFRTYVSGTQSVYTDMRFAALLGSVERLSVWAFNLVVSGTTPSLTIQIEQSPDGIRWQNQGSVPECNNISIVSLTYISFDSANDVPMANYVRLRITLGGTSPATLLRLQAAGRSPAW